MKVTLTDAEIATMAEDLDMGMRCFINIKTGKLMSAIPDDGYVDVCDENLKLFLANEDDYFELEQLRSGISFRMMEDFVDRVDDEKVKEKLINALQKRKPFRNFRDVLDHSDYIEDWYDYKRACTIDWFKQQVDDFNDTDRD